MPDSSEPVGLTPTEQAFLRALNDAEVPFMIVGLSAARLQGATLVTEDIDLWFPENCETKIAAAAKASGVVYVPAGIAMNPPQFGGHHVRFVQVLSLSGIGDFESELNNTTEFTLNGIRLCVLNLSRIIASKKAGGRAKDKAALPALEAALLAATAAK